MRDQLPVREQCARAQEDRPVQRVAVEPAEPRQAKQPRHDPDADTAQRHRSRIEGERVQPLLRAVQRHALRLVHAARLMKLLLTGPQGAEDAIAARDLPWVYRLVAEETERLGEWIAN